LCAGKIYTITININKIYWIISSILIRREIPVFLSKPVLCMEPPDLWVIKSCPVILLVYSPKTTLQKASGTPKPGVIQRTF
jgi:hypothetical protein